MPQPTAGDVHVSRPLTNISVAYIQRATNFVATKVFPVVPVQYQYDSYWTYDRTFWLRTEAQKRKSGTESAGVEYAVSTSSYRCEIRAIHHDVPDPVRANADPGLNLDRDATELVTQHLLLRREKDWATAFFATSKWTGGLSADPTPSPKWDDAAGTPIEDITAQAISVAEKTGYKPNKLVLGPEAYDKLRHHPDVLDRIKYTQRGVVTPELLAALFEVDEVLVPFATENTAAEGVAGSYGFVYGKSALLIYAAPAPGLMVPSGGYNFAWTGYSGAGPDGQRISRFRLEQLKSDRVEGEMAYDQQVVGADLGCFFQSVVS